MGRDIKTVMEDDYGITIDITSKDIASKKIKAQDGNGLRLEDDDGNGVIILDGGNIDGQGNEITNIKDPTSDAGIGDKGYNDNRYIQDLSGDATPQLGGDLETNGYLIKNAITLNASSLDTTYTIPAGYNAMSVGPLDINTTITVNGVWKIL